MKFGQPEHIKRLFLPKAQVGMSIPPNVVNQFQNPQQGMFPYDLFPGLQPQQNVWNYGTDNVPENAYTAPETQVNNGYMTISNSELLNPTTQEDTSIFTDREQLNRMAQNRASNTYLDNYDEDGQVVDQSKQVNYNDRLNLINPYGGVDPITGFAYGAFMAGQGKGGQAALGFGRGLLGAARIGMNAYGKGREYKRGLNAQNNELSPNYITLQRGGEITMADLMTGKFITDSPNPNVEIEGGEYTYNSQTGVIQEAVGENHENGGIPTNLPPQSKVLSDYEKVGRINAKELSKFLNVKVKANDTYASVLDKYSSKIGVNKTIKEESKLLEKAETLLSKEDNDTKDLNSRLLQTKFAEVEGKKQQLNQQQAQAFQELFQRQEEAKGEVSATPIMQQGGEVNPQQILEQLIAQGMSEEEAIAYMEQQMSQPQGNDIVQQAIQALQQGANPEEVLAFLVQQGIPQEQAVQIIQEASQPQQQMMQEGGTVGEISKQKGVIIRKGIGETYSNVYDLSGKRIAQFTDEETEELKKAFKSTEGNGNVYINEDKITRKEVQKLLEISEGLTKDRLLKNARIDIKNSKESPLLIRYNSNKGRLEIRDAFGEDQSWYGTSEEEAFGTIMYGNNIDDPKMVEDILNQVKQGKVSTIYSGGNLTVAQERQLDDLEKQLSNTTPDNTDTSTAQEAGITPTTTTQAEDYQFSTALNPTAQGRTVTGQRVVDTDTLTAEPIQSFAGAQGYGRNVQDVDKFMDTHSWYFNDADKREQFKQAVGTEGSQEQVKAFQEAYNNEIRNRGKEAGLSDEDINQFINEAGFTGDKVQSMDGLFGAYTSSRPIFSTTQLTTPTEGKNNDEVIKNTPSSPQTVNRTINRVPMLPSMTTMPPSAMLIPRQDQVSFNRISPVTRTPEAQIATANNQANFAIEQAYANNPNLAPFLAANLLGTTQQSANQAIAETDAFNAQAMNQANLYNAQVGDKEQLMNINLNQNFEQRLFGSLANQEADWRKWFNTGQLQQRQNWQDVNNLNLMNQLYDNYQTDGVNTYFGNARQIGNRVPQSADMQSWNGMTKAQKQRFLQTAKSLGLDTSILS
jgi:hypothetical protein